jgi:hypothetical protein
MSKLPPKDDPKRTAREVQSLREHDKAVEVQEALRQVSNFLQVDHVKINILLIIIDIRNSAGKLPTTSQLTSSIDDIQKSEVLYETARGMSPSGKKVLVDTEKVLDSAKIVLEEKNAGDELQNMVYYGTQAAKDIRGIFPNALLIAHSDFLIPEYAF